MIHESARIYGRTALGHNSLILENVILGYPHRQILQALRSKGQRIEDQQYDGTWIGDNALIRSESIIYAEVRIGKNFQTGHRVLIREFTQIGDSVSIGTNTVIEGHTSLGNNINIQSNVFIPTNTEIDDFVFIGPNVVLTNDKYPPYRIARPLKGATLGRGVSVGANAVLLPGLVIGEGSLIGAGAVVTKDVPSWTMAFGCPARIIDLPENLKVLNKI